jgi:hypothetical protein
MYLVWYIFNCVHYTSRIKKWLFFDDHFYSEYYLGYILTTTFLWVSFMSKTKSPPKNRFPDAQGGPPGNGEHPEPRTVPARSEFDSRAARDALKADTNGFAQLVEPLRILPIDAIIEEYGTDRYCKNFTTMQQLNIMVFAQYTGSSSLRELGNYLDIVGGGLNHVGISSIPPRSTLSYENNARDYRVFEAIFYHALEYTQKVFGERLRGSGPYKFSLNGDVYHFDSTVIDLCLTMYDWAQYRHTKGGIKVHLMLQNSTFLPVFAHITDAKMHDQKAMETLDPVAGLPKGSYVCVDRGYYDFSMFNSWTDGEIFFVTRAKDNIDITVLESLEVPMPIGRPSKDGRSKTYDGQKTKTVNGCLDHYDKTTVTKDEICAFRGAKAQADYPGKIRIVTAVTVSGKGKRKKKKGMRFMTNNMNLSPVTICRLYKSRWAIETFFKTLKQGLSIKSFLGTSANAVKSQIYIALTAMLLLRILQASVTTPWTMGHLVPAIRPLLNMYKNMRLWLDRNLSDSPRNSVEPPRARGRPKKKLRTFPYSPNLFAGL